MEEPAIQHGVKGAAQPSELERVQHREFGCDAAIRGLLPSHRYRGFGHVHTENPESQAGQVQRVLAGPATGIENASGESARGGQTHNRRLRYSAVPWRRPVAIRRVPRLPAVSFMAGRAAAIERIVSQAWLFGHWRSLP